MFTAAFPVNNCLMFACMHNEIAELMMLGREKERHTTSLEREMRRDSITVHFDQHKHDEYLTRLMLRHLKSAHDQSPWDFVRYLATDSYARL